MKSIVADVRGGYGREEIVQTLGAERSILVFFKVVATNRKL